MIYILGANGQLAQEINFLLKQTDYKYKVLSSQEWNVERSESADSILSSKPDILINTAAYTAVDQAEKEKDKAFKINAFSLESISSACKKYGVYLIHFSTDFVFTKDPVLQDGKLKYFSTEFAPHPFGVYSESKFKGEQIIESILNNQSTIIRTSWLYSIFGSNFPKTILKLLKDPTRQDIKVIEDQIGRPTWAGRLAEFTLLLISMYYKKDDLNSLYHFSNSGIASWYDFAHAIQEISLKIGKLKEKKSILPIPTEEYPTPAFRPRFSVLDLKETKKIFPIPHWREDLHTFLTMLND